MVERARLWRWHVAAVAIYAAESFLFLDRGASLTQRVLGSGPDPKLIMWFLAWWPWALFHHVRSLHSFLVWQPVGLNLAWTTCVPALALLAMPVTLLGGPLLAFNLLTLSAPVLAGLAAYALCLDLFEVPWAALLGGWLFGFSPYESAQSFNHLNLDFTALIPLALLVALRRVNGRMGRGPAVALLGILLGTEFLISDEILASMAMFGGIAMLLAYAMIPERRVGLRMLALDICLAAPVAALLASPVLAAMLTGDFDVAHPAKWPYSFSTDLLNFLLPTWGSAIGGAAASGVTTHFSGGLDEQAGYLGVPCLLLLAAAWRHFRAVAAFRFSFFMLGIVLLASLGPVLMIAGHSTGLLMPWRAMMGLPLIGAALPGRFMLYATLVVSIIAAGWLAPDGRRGRLLLALVVCVSFLPVGHPVSDSPESAFFRPGRLQAALGAAPRLLILPFGIAGPSSYWQAENGFGFSQVGGYLGYPPRGMQKYPAVLQLFSNKLLPGFNAQFVQFCHATGTQYVIAGPGTVPAEWAALRALDWRAERIDDVTMYVVPPT